MSISGSDRRAAVIWALVLTIFAAAPVFWWVQNRWQPVGGAMAFQKAVWLADAVVLWIALPLCIVRDVRIAAEVRRAFKVLLILMALRAVIELWMLYVSLNWSPWYGIAHDLSCMAVLAWLFARVASARQLVTRAPLWLIHTTATAAAFVPEIYFAWYMQRYFNTRGDTAVYFVPDNPAHTFALNVTSTAVVCFTTYIFIFLFRWLYATSDGGSAGAR
jgi:hypothetical protein